MLLPFDSVGSVSGMEDFRFGFQLGETCTIAIFYQNRVVGADCDEEEYGLYVVKDVYPLFALGSLTANVEHAVY